MLRGKNMSPILLEFANRPASDMVQHATAACWGAADRLPSQREDRNIHSARADETDLEAMLADALKLAEAESSARSRADKLQKLLDE